MIFEEEGAKGDRNRVGEKSRGSRPCYGTQPPHPPLCSEGYLLLIEAVL